MVYIALLVFACCCRLHEWLSAPAFAFAGTYSTTAAIYTIILSTQYKKGAFLDILALGAILGPSVIAGFILVLYSPSVLGFKLDVFFKAWELLIFGGFLAYIVRAPGLLLGELLFWVSCDGATTCNNPCSNASSPGFLRSPSDNLVPIILKTFPLEDFEPSTLSYLSTHSLPAENPQSDALNQYYWKLFATSSVIGVVFRTILLHVTERHRDTRNSVFRLILFSRSSVKWPSKRHLFLARTLTWAWYAWEILVFIIPPLLLIDCLAAKVILRYDPTGKKSAWIFKGTQTKRGATTSRITMARAISIAWYLWSYLNYLLYPAYFIYQVVSSEILLDGYPESEAPQTVGQWSTCVAIALALMAALAVHVRNSKRHRGRGKEQKVERLLRLDGSMVSQFTEASVALRQPSMFRRLSAERHLLKLVLDELQEFWTWCKDPINQSDFPEDEDQEDEDLKNRTFNSDDTACPDTFLVLDLDALWADRRTLADKRLYTLRQPYTNCYCERFAQYMPCSCGICVSRAEQKEPTDFFLQSA